MGNSWAPCLLVQSSAGRFQHSCSCFPSSPGSKWLPHRGQLPQEPLSLFSFSSSSFRCTGPYDLCRSRGSTQSSCQESVSLLGKCCVVSEEGRRYKIPLQALVWRNSEPKSVERLNRKRRGREKESGNKEKGRKSSEKAPETFLCRESQRLAHLQKRLRSASDMRLPLLLSAGVLLVALLPCPPCRALLSRGPVLGARQASQHPQPLDFFQPPPQPQQPQQPQARPVLLRLGEEYFLRLGNLNKSPAAPLSPASSPLAGSRLSPDEVAANFFRALLQQLPLSRRPLDSPEQPAERGAENALGGRQEAPERERRSEEPPISLDLTFHLLREVLEMARAEQLAQQAHSNRKLMEIIGK
ncbi:corticoliberin isoform X3 [Camelus bactrianus]